MSRESAGAAIRALRESRDWSLADLAEMTGVSVMGLSYLERGARKPHKTTVQKVENGLGLPPGTYAGLVLAPDSDAELTQLLSPQPLPQNVPDPQIVVDRHTDTSVFEGFAEAQIEAINAVVARLPASTSAVYESIVQSIVEQCTKAELLAANSWRVAVNAGADPVGPLLAHITTLETLRRELLSRLPDSLGARFDRACSQSGLPEHVVAALLGITAAEVWDIRNNGVIPAGALGRIRAFVDAGLSPPARE
ncbi:MAG: helix-turn-helix transcriptional regulator [Mycobacterium sp.]